MAFQSVLFFANEGLQAAMSNSPPLRLNATGTAVKCLQLALVALDYPLPRSTHNGLILPDGIFGPETQGAVIQFQRRNGLPPDGVVGPLTLTRLDQLLAQGGRDPLIKAVHDCQICAARLIRVYQVNPDTPADGERAEFKRKLGYVDQLMLGNPIRQGVKIQSLLRNVYR